MLWREVLTTTRPRHRQQEFLAFLGHIDANMSADLDVHQFIDNYGTHKHAKVRAWLARHPRHHVHFTPTYASWLNQVERWFGLITQQAIRAKIDRFVAVYNATATPFTWTAAADSIQRPAKLLSRTRH